MVLNAIRWTLDPEIFKLFGTFSIRYYGLMWALAFIFGYYIMSKIFKREGLSIELLDKLTIYIAIGTIAGARLGHCLFYEPQDFLPKPWTIVLPFRGVPFTDSFEFTGYQGLASHGAAIGILISLYLFRRKYGFKMLYSLDRISIVAALGGFFVRLGNLFNSEIYGVQTDLPWGFLFVKDKLYDPATGELLPTVPRHPTQLYEAFSYLLIFFMLYFLYKKYWKKMKDGFIFSILLITMFTARFLVEFVKNDQVGFENGMKLNMGQWLSVPFILVGIFILYYNAKIKTDNN